MRKFESRYKQIMECLSTEMFGNSQPTGGVFSGDNFASGDTRIPVPLGGYKRFGKVGKKKKVRKVNENATNILWDKFGPNTWSAPSRPRNYGAFGYPSEPTVGLSSVKKCPVCGSPMVRNIEGKWYCRPCFHNRRAEQ